MDFNIHFSLLFQKCDRRYRMRIERCIFANNVIETLSVVFRGRNELQRSRSYVNVCAKCAKHVANDTYNEVLFIIESYGSRLR